MRQFSKYPVLGYGVRQSVTRDARWPESLSTLGLLPCMGSVLDVEMTILDKQSKGVPIDEQAYDDVVHLYRFREADRLTDQAFDPRS